MSDLKFACPSCAQHIQCDEQWKGQTIQCPSCHTSIMVPSSPEGPPTTATEGPRDRGTAFSHRPLQRPPPSHSRQRLNTILGVLIFLTAALFVGFITFRGTRKLTKAKAGGEIYACRGRLTALESGLVEVLGDKAAFPNASNWCDVLLVSGVAGANGFETDPRRAFRCPAGDPSKPCHYAFNKQLSGVPMKAVNPSTVVLFETDGGWNVAGGPELLLSRPRHGDVIMVLLANLQIVSVPTSQLATLRWNP